VAPAPRNNRFKYPYFNRLLDDLEGAWGKNFRPAELPYRLQPLA